uniref:JmjC domain-containing protein n=1 Tax=Macrostomum lignano TaxID=282301 RepID=A0A1I8F4Y9_9PLAT
AALQQERRLDRLPASASQPRRAEDLAAWLRKPPNGAAAAAAPGVVASEARRLLSFVGEAFQELASQERQLRARYGGAGGDGTNAASLLAPSRRRRRRTGTGQLRTACDQCDSNAVRRLLSAAASACGYALCPDCRLSDPAAAASSRCRLLLDRPATRLRPGGGVAAAGDCTVGRQAHEPDRLLLATNVPGDAFARLASAVASLRVPPLSPPESPPPPPPPVAADSPADPDAEAAYNRGASSCASLSRRARPTAPAAWPSSGTGAAALPVVVANCLPAAAAPLLRTPGGIAQSEPRPDRLPMQRVLKLRRRHRAARQPTRHFWDGFDSMKRRLEEPRHRRPAFAAGSARRRPAVQPALSELAKAVLHRRPRPLQPGGRQRARCPARTPRLTCAYGMSRTETAGTFALHCQPADLAVLLLAHVAAPEDALEQQKAAAFAALERASVDPGVLRSIAVDSRLPGALWHVFRPADAAKTAPLPGCRRPKMAAATRWRSRRAPTAACAPAVIVQFQGRHRLRAAGAPYQVRNLHSGISLSVDFVSQESCASVWPRGREMRQHNRLPLRRLLYRAVRDAVSHTMDGSGPFQHTMDGSAAHFEHTMEAAAPFQHNGWQRQFQHMQNGPFQHTMDGSGPFQTQWMAAATFQATMDGSSTAAGHISAHAILQMAARPISAHNGLAAAHFSHNGWQQHPFQLQTKRNISDMQWHKAGGGHTMVPGQGDHSQQHGVRQRQRFQQSHSFGWWVKPASRQSPFTPAQPAVLVRRAAVDDALDDDGLRPGEAVGAANDGEAERAGAGVPGQGPRCAPALSSRTALLVAEAQQRDVVSQQQYVSPFLTLPGTWRPGRQAAALVNARRGMIVAALGGRLPPATDHMPRDSPASFLNHHNPAPSIVGLIVHGIHGGPGAGVSQVGSDRRPSGGAQEGEAGIARGQSRRGQLAAAQIREA